MVLSFSVAPVSRYDSRENTVFLSIMIPEKVDCVCLVFTDSRRRILTRHRKEVSRGRNVFALAVKKVKLGKKVARRLFFLFMCGPHVWIWFWKVCFQLQNVVWTMCWSWSQYWSCLLRICELSPRFLKTNFFCWSLSKPLLTIASWPLSAVESNWGRIKPSQVMIQNFGQDVQTPRHKNHLWEKLSLVGH